MSAAINLYLSTVAAWVGVVLAVGSLVYLCFLACRCASRVWRTWRLNKLWNDEYFEAMQWRDWQTCDRLIAERQGQPYDWDSAA